MLEQIIVGLNVNKHKDLYILGESRKFLHSVIEIPQSLLDKVDIQAILPTHSLIIFTKFLNIWIKSVVF